MAFVKLFTLVFLLLAAACGPGYYHGSDRWAGPRYRYGYADCPPYSYGYYGPRYRYDYRDYDRYGRRYYYDRRDRWPSYGRRGHGRWQKSPGYGRVPQYGTRRGGKQVWRY